MKPVLIKNARIPPIQGAGTQNGYILVRDGKIAAVGDMAATGGAVIIPLGCTVIDARGGVALPGFIDIHSHLGLYEDSLGFEGADGNEDTDPITPHLRVIDGINPMERAFREALEAGVTTTVVSPGSANPIGGQLAAIKTWGRRIDDMVIKAPAGIKFAFGENPKATYHEKEESPVTRMATAALIRENLQKAQEYLNRKCLAEEQEDNDPPDFDAKLEALGLLLAGKIPAHIHAHRADDIFTALRICREFDIRPILIHGTEAHLVADIIRDEGVPVVSGPYMTDRSKPELANLTEAAPDLLARAGIPVAITTDHPEMPLKYLRIAAGVAVNAGMDALTALRAITISPARIAGLDKRVGSLEKGKDADIVVFNGDVFDFRSQVMVVLCNGHIAYRRNME